MCKNFPPILATIALLVCFNVMLPTAEGAEFLREQRAEALKTVLESPLSQCHTTLTNAFDLELAAFFMFLDEHFLNESFNSSLTNIAISRFAEFRTNIENIHNSLTPAATEAGQLTNVEEIATLETCEGLKEEYIFQGRDKMVEHIKNKQAQKRTMIIVEKYKAINSGLRDMNIQIARMYSFFMAFNNRLPRFVSECVQN